jgi:hypothetical protein
LLAIGVGAAAGCGSGDGDDGTIRLEFALDEEASGYEELRPMLAEMEASDENGHLDQRVITDWVRAGLTDAQLEFLFDHGDELTEIEFTSADGIGALNTSARFARHPTRDRFTGPNASSCGACHDQPLGNGAGRNVANVVQDPEPGIEGDYNIRNTRNINGDAWLQLASLEMTLELRAQRDDMRASVQLSGLPSSVTLQSKGVNFGSVSCSPDDSGGVTCDYGSVRGVSPDLVVRSQGWKGNFTTVRAFSEDAFFGEMGIHSDRLVHHLMAPGQPVPDDVQRNPPDVDEDGVVNEMSVGDITAMAIYLAAQAPPTTLLELSDEGKVRLAREDRDKISAGEGAFASAGCDSCHRLELPVMDSLFREPDARSTSYFDFLLAQSNNGYDPVMPVEIDLASTGIVERHLSRVTGADGQAYYPVRALTDLKRHFLGNHLCDDAKVYQPVNGSFLPAGSPSDSTETMSMSIDRCDFLTADLWGIAGTGPYMHDGRAATLAEAIGQHCSVPGAERVGEADESCRRFLALPSGDQVAVIAFLRNQVMEPE